MSVVPYSMIVTTHDRAALLARLFAYLEAHKAAFPIVVLDSSESRIVRQNADRITQSPLAARHLTYPPSLDPYLKVRDGLDAIETPYTSLCADDDVVFLPALKRCLDILGQRPDVSAAHGRYVNFCEGASFDLSYVIYRGPSLVAADALGRLHQMFSGYEAVYYAVHRTAVLRDAFRRVAELETVLGRELLTAAITALAGKVLRTEDIYYGRSTAESLPFSNWHPHEILAREPQLLVDEYARFRTILLDRLGDGADDGGERDGAVVDLILLRYLEPFLRSDVMDLIMDDRLRGLDAGATVAHLKDVFVRSVRGEHGIEPLSDGQAFGPDRFKGGGEWKDYVVTRPTRSGRPRTYRLFHEFLFPDGQPPALVSAPDVFGMLERLDAY